jgi:membrane protein YqaA with SNARE-associated domain
MPNIIEREIERQRKFIDIINNFIFGDVTKIEEPFRWYNWLNLIMKILTPIACVIFYIYGMFEISFLLYVAFILDYCIIFYNVKKYVRYKEYQHFMKQVKIPKNRWGK